MTPSLPSTPSSRPGSGAASRPPRTPRPPAGPSSAPAATSSSPRPPAPARRSPPSSPASTASSVNRRPARCPPRRRSSTSRPSRRWATHTRRTGGAPLAEKPEPPPRRGFALAIRTAVRTGDTPAKDRQAFVRTPPHILITTPESLYLMLTAARRRETLRRVRTVTVGEIHALARAKRGSHLALSLARLDHVVEARPARIGLSATQRPIEGIAAFPPGPGQGPGNKEQGPTPSLRGPFVFASGQAPAEATSGRRRGTEIASSLRPPQRQGPPVLGSSVPCSILDHVHLIDLDLQIELPPSDLEAVASGDTWGDVYDRLAALVRAHRTTLVFVNTRRLSERVAHHLRERLGEGAGASHHGSLAPAPRPRAPPRPRLPPPAGGERAGPPPLPRAGAPGRLDAIVQPVAPLDILAQQ